MRILHVATHAQARRGGAVQLCRMASGLAARGNEVRVFANDGGDGLAFDAESWRIRLPADMIIENGRLARPWGRFRLRRTIGKWQPRILHAHRDDALCAAARVCGRGDRPLIVAQRGTTREPGPEIQAVFRSERVAGVVAVAERVREVLVNQVGVPAAKVRTIYGGVDLEQFRPVPRNAACRRELGFTDDDFVLGSLSAWREAKGLESILRAMAIARKDAPQLALLFLGDGVEPKLKPLAQELGMLARCRFAGHQSAVVDWLAAMDSTVVAASSREGLSGVLRESLACEVPVISTDSDGNGEIVRDGVTGLLVPARDDEALAAAFVRAARERDAMRDLARAGREWVRANCSVAHQAATLEAFYHELAREHPDG